MKPLFDTILKYVQPPEGEPDEPLQMLVSSVDYNDFVGRMGVGRVQNGVIKVGSPIQVCDWHNPDVHMSGRITKLFDFKANGREPIESAQAGDIVALAGLPDISIGKMCIRDSYYAEVLPEDKANFVEQEKAAGHTVIMLGDGINDSPALSAADVGIAISDGAAIAREIADVTIAADSLRELVILKSIANGLQKRTKSNYRFIMSFNSTLIVLGAMGILPPATSALLHNASTLGVSLKSMTNLLD